MSVKSSFLIRFLNSLSLFVQESAPLQSRGIDPTGVGVYGVNFAFKLAETLANGIGQRGQRRRKRRSLRNLDGLSENLVPDERLEGSKRDEIDWTFEFRLKHFFQPQIPLESYGAFEFAKKVKIATFRRLTTDGGAKQRQRFDAEPVKQTSQSRQPFSNLAFVHTKIFARSKIATLEITHKERAIDRFPQNFPHS